MHDNYSRAESLIRKIIRNDCNTAIWMQNYKNTITFRTSRVGNELYNSIINNHDYLHGPMKLVGIYTVDVKFDYVLEDLDYMTGD